MRNVKEQQQKRETFYLLCCCLTFVLFRWFERLLHFRTSWWILLQPVNHLYHPPHLAKQTSKLTNKSPEQKLLQSVRTKSRTRTDDDEIVVFRLALRRHASKRPASSKPRTVSDALSKHCFKVTLPKTTLSIWIIHLKLRIVPRILLKC